MAKPDSEQIRQFFESLPKALGLRDGKEVWPKFLFHVTDISNALSILKRGALLSRNDARKLGVLIRDSANQGIIHGTGPSYMDRARLYFRPRAPTHFRTEGFRPTSDPSRDDSYMPLPIVFVFDSLEILTRDGVLFTDGNAGTEQHRAGSDIQFLKSIPFEHVYSDVSDGPTPHDTRMLTFHRNAEVCVPSPITLANVLQGVYTRTEAELDTLLHKLDSDAIGTGSPFFSKIKQNSQSAKFRDLFYRRWLHISRVMVAGINLKILFVMPQVGTPNFSIQLTIASSTTGNVFGRYLGSGSTPEWIIRLPDQCTNSNFVVHISIDGDLAYENTFPSLSTKLLTS
jgi:hypothetical protein